MALTRAFKQTVVDRIQREPEYAEALFQEALQAMFDGELDVGKAILRDYINATIGFDAVASAVGKNRKSVMRMFSASGNPNAANLFDVVGALRHQNRVVVTVAASRTAERGKRRTA